MRLLSEGFCNPDEEPSEMLFKEHSSEDKRKMPQILRSQEKFHLFLIVWLGIRFVIICISLFSRFTVWNQELPFNLLKLQSCQTTQRTNRKIMCSPTTRRQASSPKPTRKASCTGSEKWGISSLIRSGFLSGFASWL